MLRIMSEFLVYRRTIPVILGPLPLTMLLCACGIEHKAIDLEINEFEYSLHTAALALFQ
jgi:hypothetical protein